MKSTNFVVLDKISASLKEQGKTQKMLCESLGLNGQAYTNWKGGSNDSYMKYLPQISEYLGVSIDYLLGNSTPAKTSLLPADLLEIITTFSEEEMKDLENYVHYIVSKRK